MRWALVVLCALLVATVSNAAEIVSARLEVRACYQLAANNHVYGTDLWWMTSEQATIGKGRGHVMYVLFGLLQVKKFINDLLPL